MKHRPAMRVSRLAASVVASIVLAGLMWGGCSNPGEQTLADAVDLTERLAAIVEAHRCDPEALDAAVAAFAAAEAPALDALRRSTSDLQRALSASDRRALRDRWQEVEARLTPRLGGSDCEP